MEKGAITLLDILGWKGIWQRNNNAIDALMEIINSTKTIHNDLFQSNRLSKEGIPNFFKEIKTQITSISDSIAIVSYGDMHTSIEYHALLSSFIIIDSIQKGLPVRGAICYGELQTKENIFAGPAVDEVAMWYECAEWIGVALSPSAFYGYKSQKNWLNHILREYKINVKGIGEYNTLCVDWSSFWKNDNKDGDALLKNYFLKLGAISPDIALKLSNTLKFYNAMNNK